MTTAKVLMKVPGLTGERVLLRAPRPEDADALYEITQDATVMMMLSARSWVPDSLDGFRTRHAARLREAPDASDAWFVVADPDDSEVYGQADLWGIDSHNRTANIGLALLARWRSQGLGREVVTQLCRYAFAIRGLNRVQYEASAPNPGSIRAAEHAGFRREVLLRQYEWTFGRLTDAVVLGQLAREWREGRERADTHPPTGPTPVPTGPVAGQPTPPVPAAHGRSSGPDPLTGRLVRLRAVRPPDAPAIWRGRHDLDTWLLGQEDPWLPIPYSHLERAAAGTLQDEPPTREVSFAVEEAATGDVVGTAFVHVLRAPQRTASIGVTLWPAERGRGLGTDVLQVVSRYLFEVRGMFRAEIETLAANAPMLAAARRAGFVEEGRRREHAWVDGAFADVVVAGLLLPDWQAAGDA